ncbi:hypothetical protein ILUMI_09970 [Ignelater luminosus]|uniref:Uncharacterized protein n=1 Tax=Ignelater luminosus TaxID=2038154 RepID=A0A8K0D369_IGNLU|nr:hypothetical protein ILUMI_09970 [Ignelater luminosus]
MTKIVVLIVLIWISCCYGFFSIKDWGENCTHSDECFDHRMICEPDENNITRCFCDRFHAWNESAEQCIQVYSAAYIMNETVTVRDNQEKLRIIQDSIFNGPIYSIYFMMFVIVTCTISIVIYCIYVRIKDNHLRHVIIQMTAENEELKKRRQILHQASSSQC